MGKSCLCAEPGQRGSHEELSCVQLGRIAVSRETAQERPGHKTLDHRACTGDSLAVPASWSDAFCSGVFNGPEAAAVSILATAEREGVSWRQAPISAERLEGPGGWNWKNPGQHGRVAWRWVLMAGGGCDRPGTQGEGQLFPAFLGTWGAGRDHETQPAPAPPVTGRTGQGCLPATDARLYTLQEACAGEETVSRS